MCEIFLAFIYSMLNLHTLYLSFETALAFFVSLKTYAIQSI